MVNSLNIDPDLPVISEWTLLLFGEAIILAALIIAGVMNLKKHPWLSIGILWFFLNLIPSNSVIPRLDIANERHLYLSSWGLFLVIGILMSKFMNLIHVRYSFKRIAIIMLILILVFFTVKRNFIYRSEVALWEDTVLKSPMKARVFNNLGYAYALDGRFKDARDAYTKALSLKPDYGLARNNLKRLLDN